jgi:hypothetical protein
MRGQTLYQPAARGGMPSADRALRTGALRQAGAAIPGPIAATIKPEHGGKRQSPQRHGLVFPANDRKLYEPM